LPYFFLSNDARMWRYEMLYHDEALYLMQGRDILAGKLPFIGHWDNRPPFGWVIFALFNFLSGENLVVFRLLGALYIAVTAHVLYRTLADRQKAVAGLMAGLFYVVFCSVAQISQSVTYEHVAALPLSVMLYFLLNPKPGKYQRRIIALLFAMTVLILTNFIFLGPALALLMPSRFGKHDVSVPPVLQGWALWWRAFGRYALFVVYNGVVLLGAVFACYAVIFTVYWIQGQHEFLLRSLIDAPFVVSRQPMDEKLVTQVFVRWQSFSERFLNSYLYSNEWLIPFMLSVFACRVGGALFEPRQRRDVVIIALMILLCAGSVALFFRGGNFWNFPYYLLQIMPIVALAMGCAMAFRMGDARLVMMAVILWGISDATRVVLNQYKPLIAYMQGDESASEVFLHDRLYQLADEINKLEVQGENMIVCNEDSMLFILTHMENPRYFIFPPFLNFSQLDKVLEVSLEPLQKTVLESSPAVIVGWRGDSCFSVLSKQLRDYEIFTVVQNTLVYVRKDILTHARGIDPVTPQQAP